MPVLPSPAAGRAARRCRHTPLVEMRGQPAEQNRGPTRGSRWGGWGDDEGDLGVGEGWEGVGGGGGGERARSSLSRGQRALAAAGGRGGSGCLSRPGPTP
jgi:hypothetical protein